MKLGWHLCNEKAISSSDWQLMEILRPDMIVFLPSSTLSPQKVQKKDIERILAMSPNADIFLRPYVPPTMLKTREEFLPYIDDLCNVALEWMNVIPDGQRHLQIFNEPNQPNGVEGFGETIECMHRFSHWFVEAYQRVKRTDRNIKIGFTPLTPGNRDAWFKGDPVGQYYMHGVAGCKETLSPAEIFSSIYSGPCAEALNICDEYYAHVYVHAQHGMASVDAAVNKALGLRHERYRMFFPRDIPLWITECGIPSASYRSADSMVGILKWVDNLKNVNGAALWILGNYKQWGDIWSSEKDTVRELAAKQVTTPCLEETLFGMADEHCLSSNPDAALEKGGRVRGFYPVSNELRTERFGVRYAVQFFKDSALPKRLWTAYCVEGHWADIYWFSMEG